VLFTVLLSYALAGQNIALPAEAEYLLPTPQEVTWQGEVSFAKPLFQIHDELGLAADSLDWLRSGLQEKLSWQESETATSDGGCRLEFKRISEDQISEEYYRFSCSQGQILIEAATTLGGIRGIGRLLCLLEMPLVKVLPDGRTVMPALTIRDWPDTPFRGIHFQIGSPYSARRYHSVSKMLEAMGKLSLNYAVLELGGRFNCKSYPEINRLPNWPDDKLREIIAFAKARGITALPGTNSIGHTGSAPNIFQLSGMGMDYSKNRLVNRAELIMDLAHPDFYKVWFAYLDELTDFFGKRKYVLIGTDEFADGAPLLAGKMNCEPEQFYADFLNRTHRYMKSKGITVVPWHDMMLGAKVFPRQACNGFAKTLDLLDKDLNIAYWQYSNLERYTGLEFIYEKGFRNLWVAAWYDPDNNKNLFNTARKLGSTHLLGSTWGFPLHHLGFPASAEYAWNSKDPWGKDCEYFFTCNDLMFYARANKVPPSHPQVIAVPADAPPVLPELQARLAKHFPEQKITVSGIEISLQRPVSFSQTGMTPPAEYPQPWDFPTLEKNNVIFCLGNSMEWVIPHEVRYNKARIGAGIVIYDRKYGSSTKTNIYGSEIVIRDGVIEQLSGTFDYRYSEKGDMAIPEGTCVFSMRDIFQKYPRRQREFYRSVFPNQQVVLRYLPKDGEVSPQQLTLPLTEKRQGVVIFVTTALPFERNRILAECELLLSNGKRQKIPLQGNDFLTTKGWPIHGWQRWLACPGGSDDGLNPVLALEWSAPKNQPVELQELIINASSDGVISGLTILGGIQF